tara:strand:+ start:374 stop:583 length:210 start_codon:yes stop_codon:yes gene_type:complete
VKKDNQEITTYERESEQKQNLYSENFKTTNVNILLNRVRSDKKKTFRKKIIISFILVSIIIAIYSYFII